MTSSALKNAWTTFQQRPLAQKVGITTATVVGGSIALRLLSVGAKYLSYRSREKSKPFNSYSSAEEALNNLNLTGKLAIVTGCNAGIGKESVRALAKQGCNIIMACRSQSKAEAARSEILSSLGLDESSKQLEIVLLDLSSLQSVLNFAKTIKARNLKIDYLINNAGIMALPEYKESADGYEMQVATNHLGHFYLTKLLLPTIVASGSGSQGQLPRVINVSSAAHRQCPPYEKFSQDLDYFIENKCFMGDKKNEYEAFVNYGMSKAANVLFTRELQKRYQTKLMSVCLHPGVILTELARHMGNTKILIFMGTMLILRPDFMFDNYKSMTQGAATTMRCVSMTDGELEPAAYYHNCNSGEKDKLLGTCKKDEDGKLAQKLWTLSEILIQEKGFPLEI